MAENWINACATSEIDEEELIRFDHYDKTFYIYHTTNGFFATDGMCTHEGEHLEFGLVIDCIIECPCTRLNLTFQQEKHYLHPPVWI